MKKTPILSLLVTSFAVFSNSCVYGEGAPYVVCPDGQYAEYNSWGSYNTIPATPTAPAKPAKTTFTCGYVCDPGWHSYDGCASPGRHGTLNEHIITCDGYADASSAGVSNCIDTKSGDSVPAGVNNMTGVICAACES